MNITQFEGAWAAAKPGEAIVYFTGVSLEYDALMDAEVCETAQHVRDLHDAGYLIPLQKRVGVDTRQYLAVKRRVRRLPSLRFSDKVLA